MIRSSLGILCTVTALSCTSKQLPHTGEDPVYPLRGLHSAVACEECHGTSGFEQLPNTCVACHEEDRPSKDHYPGEACDGCHIEEGWAVVDTIPTIETGDPKAFDHSILPETQLCWQCHEKDRLDPKHYADPAQPMAQWGDCSGCHETTAWTPNIVHPARIPHGSTASPGCTPIEDPTGWVTGCVGCHPDGTDTFVCYSCHEGVHPDANYPETLCLTCHNQAEPTGCEP